MLLEEIEIIECTKYNEKITEIIFWYLEKIYDKFENNLIEMNDCEDFLIGISNLLPIIPDSQKEKYIYIGYELVKILKDKIESNIFKKFYPLFFQGLGYSAYSIYSFNRSTGLLSNFLNDINKLLLNEGYNKSKQLIDYYENNTSTFDYDAIYGISGILNYLLEFEWTKDESYKIEVMIAYLVTLSEEINYNEYTVPKIFISNVNSTESERGQFLFGNINLGLSHGIAAPLKVLTIAKSKKYNVEGIDDAISTFFDIYNDFEIEKDNTITWPPMIGLEEYNCRTLKDHDYSLGFNKWCYGSLSLSLVLADASIDEKQYLKYHNNCKQIAKQYFKEYCFFTPNICHGYASMLAMQIFAYKKSKDKIMLTNLDYSIGNILECFDEYSEYGFKICSDIDLEHEFKNYEINSYDFLEGTTGIVLALSLIFNNDYDFNKLLFFS